MHRFQVFRTFFRCASINTELCRLSSEVVSVRATHHSSQAVLLHQPEGVLVAGSEVIGLGGAHVTPGHRAHGVDDICHAEKQHRVPFQHGRLSSKGCIETQAKRKVCIWVRHGDAADDSSPRDERIYSGNETAAWIENQLQDSFMRSAQIFMSPLVLSFPLQSNISTCQSPASSSVPARLGNALP